MTYTLNEYQKDAGRTYKSTPDDFSLTIHALGVAGEAGEVADLVKKWVGHKKARDPEALKKELGDVLWYVAAIASDMGFTLEEVAVANVEKLLRRYPEGFSVEAANKDRSKE